MNFSSIFVLCIVAGLLIFSIVCSRKHKKSGCGGDCADCASSCGFAERGEDG